jgi:hypothetical protein
MSTARGVSFDVVCRAAGLPRPVPEFQFAIARGRKWAFDWAWPAEKLALEVEGGAWIQGRHQRPAGFLKDIEKYNTATLDGWRVLRTTPRALASAPTLDMIRQALINGRPILLV